MDQRAARKHVAQGEALKARQRKILDQLARDGHSTDLATHLLEAWAQLMDSYAALLDRLAKEAHLPSKTGKRSTPAKAGKQRQKPASDL